MMDVSTIHVEQLFSTPLAIETISAEVVVAAEILAAYGDFGAQWRGPGWPTTFEPLVRHVMSAAARLTIDVTRATPLFRWQPAVAVRSAAAGDRIVSEPHWEAFWSALYVAEDGYQGKEDSGLGGELVLHDPRLPTPMMEMPDLRLRTALGETGAIYTPTVTIRPRSATLLLFPGWLRVEHRPLKIGAGRRVLVAVDLVAPLGGMAA